MRKLFDRPAVAPREGVRVRRRSERGGGAGVNVEPHEGVEVGSAVARRRARESLVNVLDIAVAVVDAKRAAGPREAMQAFLAAVGGAEPPVRQAPPEALAACVEILPRLVTFLDVDDDASGQRTTWGVMAPPLGLKRVKAVDALRRLPGFKVRRRPRRRALVRRPPRVFPPVPSLPVQQLFAPPRRVDDRHGVGVGPPGSPRALRVRRRRVATSSGSSPRTRRGRWGRRAVPRGREISVTSPESGIDSRRSRRGVPTRVPTRTAPRTPPREPARARMPRRVARMPRRVAQRDAFVAAKLEADARWAPHVDGPLKERNTVENVYKWAACGRPAGMDDGGLGEHSAEEDDHDFDVGLGGGGFTRDGFDRYGGVGLDDDDEDDEEDDDGPVPPGAAGLFQGDASARLASLTLSNAPRARRTKTTTRRAAKAAGPRRRARGSPRPSFAFRCSARISTTRAGSPRPRRTKTTWYSARTPTRTRPPSPCPPLRRRAKTTCAPARSRRARRLFANARAFHPPGRRGDGERGEGGAGGTRRGRARVRVRVGAVLGRRHRRLARAGRRVIGAGGCGVRGERCGVRAGEGRGRSTCVDVDRGVDARGGPGRRRARQAAESHGVSVFLCDSRSKWVFKEKSRTYIHIFGHTRASVRHPEAGRR